MEQLNTDIIFYEIFYYLSYQDILRLCQTQKYFNLCQNPELWVMLLERDFDEVSLTPKKTYQSYIYIINYFSPYFPIIT